MYYSIRTLVHVAMHEYNNSLFWVFIVLLHLVVSFCPGCIETSRIALSSETIFLSISVILSLAFYLFAFFYNPSIFCACHANLLWRFALYLAFPRLCIANSPHSCVYAFRHVAMQ